MSAAKDFLKKTKLHRVQTSRDAAQQNLQMIQGLLQQFAKETAEADFAHIQQYLQNVAQGVPMPLNLPKLEVGVLSLVLNNLALFLGNTQQASRLQQEIQMT